MANIDKIRVNGTSYNINLPTTATPSIASLTVTGDLTVSGTANLADINCAGLTCSGQVTTRSAKVSTLTAAIANISSTLLVGDGIVGASSSRAVRFLTNIGSPGGALYLTPLSTTTTNRIWVLDNRDQDLTLRINGSVQATNLMAGGSDDGYVKIYPTFSTNDPAIVFYDHANDAETTLTQSIQSKRFELHTDNKFLFQENTQKFQFPATGGTLVTKDDIDLINERLDDLGFKEGVAGLNGEATATVNSLTKQGRMVLFNLEFTGYVSNIEIPEGFRPPASTSGTGPDFAIVYKYDNPFGSGTIEQVLHPSWNTARSQFSINAMTSMGGSIKITNAGWKI